MVLCRGFFMTSFFLPSWYFGNLKPKSVILNYQAREAHPPIPSSISSPCLYRAVVSYSVLGEIWLLFSSYSIRMVLFLAYASPHPCCWKHVSSLAWICASNYQRWSWTMVICWILTVRLKPSHTWWLEKEHAASSPQIFQDNFKLDL